MKCGDDRIGIIMLWEFIIWLVIAAVCLLLVDGWKDRWMHTEAVDHLLHMEQEMIRERDLYCKVLHYMADSYYKISMVHVDTGNCRHIKVSDWELRRMQVTEADGPFAGNRYELWLEAVLEELIQEGYRAAFQQTFSLNNLRRCLTLGKSCQTLAYRQWDSETCSYRWMQAVAVAMSPGYREMMFYIRDMDLRLLAVARHSRMQIAGMELKRAKLNIAHLVKTCKKYLNAILRDKPLSIMWIGSLEGQYIGDEVRLKQCLFQLLDNAVQQSRLDGFVRIELRKGVSPLNEAADEFMIEIRRDSSETETSTGIAFVVAKTILDAMKGEIHVKSKNGQGTTVTVYFSLPRA